MKDAFITALLWLFFRIPVALAMLVAIIFFVQILLGGAILCLPRSC